MKEITEGEAREALEKLYTNALGGIGMGQFKKEKEIFSTLITRFFEMEKVMKEILNFAYHPDGCQCEDRFKIAQQALTGKGKG